MPVGVDAYSDRETVDLIYRSPCAHSERYGDDFLPGDSGADHYTDYGIECDYNHSDGYSDDLGGFYDDADDDSYNNGDGRSEEYMFVTGRHD